MPDWFDNPAVRHHFGTAGLDWKVILTEQTEDGETEETSDTPETDVEDDT
ncbi:hypothetical protein [Streptomyces sp. NRRL F-5122]|nr:hypothetical protein [Streptomyces sp. NRRL F-5122]